MSGVQSGNKAFLTKSSFITLAALVLGQLSLAMSEIALAKPVSAQDAAEMQDDASAAVEPKSDVKEPEAEAESQPVEASDDKSEFKSEAYPEVKFRGTLKGKVDSKPGVGAAFAAGTKVGNFVSPFDVLPLPTSIQFAVVFDTEVDSRSAREGDLIEGHLKNDLVFDNHLIAAAGSAVIGHISHYVRSRTMTQAMASGDKRFHKTSIVKFSFDEIVTPEFEHIKIVGMLSKQKANFGESIERSVEIGKGGIVEKAEQSLSDETMVGAQVVNYAVSTGLSQLGSVATFGVLPVVMGAIGAINPSIITMKAVTKEDKHPRMRGMTMGVVSSLPGGPVMQSLIYHGSELNIKVGDELLVQAHSPYEDLARTTAVSAKIAPRTTASAGDIGQQESQQESQLFGRHYYPKYQPKYVPKAGNKVMGTNNNHEDRFGLWQ